MKKLLIILMTICLLVLISCDGTGPEPTVYYITVTSPNGGEDWRMGTSHNITWNDNISSNVKIELYKSGSYYRTISNSTSSDGTYSWSIPTDLVESSSYKVKVTSTSNSSVNDQSNNYFTIKEADYITLTSPNGSETWQMGTLHNITWNDNITSNVKIELYKSGSFNITIVSSTGSDGTYSWSIPTDLTESSSYKVKITSTSNSSVNDQSNNYFTIEEADYITVTTPNGGETWEMGTSCNITWNDNISSNVKIELYKSGSFYRTISSSTSSDGTYNWNIPNDLEESSIYKVKITSTSNGSLNDYSDNYFTIEEETQADYITVTSPNGGETWQMGTSYNITWNDNITNNVKIELYKSGSYYRTISSSTSSDGTYSWSIPTDLTESSSYKVKIISTSNSSVNDQSNNYFTIEEADYITVTSPNGGETWEMGTSCNITWNDNISSNVKIELYKSGSFYRTISSSTSSDGTYNWNIPNDLEESSIYKVKITSTSNGSLNDYSDNYFTIEEETQADYITITSPNGSETWQMSTSHNITWDDNISSNVKIELYKSGSYYRTISSSTSSDGTYNWSIPTDLVESSWYKVKIISTSNSSLYDESNSYFTIEEQPYITVTSPNGGETCQMGTSYNITWDDNISSNVKIELCKSGTYNILIEDSTPSDGSYSWSIPTDLTASSSYKVKVTSNSNSSIYDYSNNDFTIEESDYITVTSPNGGETWEMGTSCNITWNDNVSSNVKIELYKSGSYYRTITTSTSSDGLYSSIIPTDLAESSSYKVKITSTSNSSVYDYSNNYFTIEESDYITVTSPNGGENWKILTVKQITWNDNISSNVKIDLYKSGSYYRTITTSTSSDGFYNWNISNVLEESSSYKVKITSTSNSSIYDYSNNNFTLFVDSGTVTDVDGNVYNTIWIGDQRWMMENLKVTHYRNGATIPKVTNNGTWAGLSTGAYCNYGNDNGNVATYGRLYNWYAVDDSRGIAPEGWHVPTYDDWQILLDYLGSGAGGKMKETGTTHWNSPNTGATNESGFTALPGGYRHYYDGDFLDMGNYANFWCSSVYSSTYVWNIYLATHNNGCSIEPHFKGWGFSIRCVKD